MSSKHFDGSYGVFHQNVREHTIVCAEERMSMSREYVIPAQSGHAFRMRKGETIDIVDVEGQQVADFWALHEQDRHEFLSPGVTMDCNASLSISQGASMEDTARLSRSLSRSP